MEARIYVPSSNNGGVAIDVFDNVPPWGCDRRTFYLRFLPDGSVCYYREHDTLIPGLRIKTDAWQDLFIRAHMKNTVFDVTVDGETVKSLPFADGAVHRLMTICLGPNSNNSTLYVGRLKAKVIP